MRFINLPDAERGLMGIWVGMYECRKAEVDDELTGIRRKF